MFVNFSYASPALLETFAKFGPQITKIPNVTVKDGIYYVDLSPNTGYLAVDLRFSKAYRVAKIGDPEGSETHCSAELLALVLKVINDELDKQ